MEITETVSMLHPRAAIGKRLCVLSLFRIAILSVSCIMG